MEEGNTTEENRESVTDYDIAKKLVQLKQSATHRGLKFNLSFITVKRLLLAKTCFYTGVKFSTEVERSVDRVDSTLGYVEGNVVPCTVAINTKKSNLTHDEIFMLAKKIKLHNSKKK
jgi:hypothetical protein